MIKVNVSPPLVPATVLGPASQLSTSLLSDAMSGLGVMDCRIKPIKAGMKLVGTAFTVDLKIGSAPAVIAAVGLADAGHVLVISGKGDEAKAVFGDLLALIAKKRNLQGIVVDGLVRDVATLREFGLPVFAVGTVPVGAEKEGPGEINCPVACGGIVVRPGDLIVGDDDGVVVVSPDRTADVFQAAQEKLQAEEQIIRGIEQGNYLPEGIKQKLCY